MDARRRAMRGIDAKRPTTRVFRIALAVLFALASAAGADATAKAPRPNLILIVTDDQSVDTLAEMPRLATQLSGHGTTFRNAFVPITACCPSRISILRSQYAHNHGVTGNSGPTGGFAGFTATGGQASTLATWLQAAGYRTALVGKYLNGFEAGDEMSPGWDVWYATTQGGYFGVRIDANGKELKTGKDVYLTDFLRDRALEFVKGSLAQGRPFFLYLTPYAPHKPADPAPRHRGLFDARPIPRPPSFDEGDVGDKPAGVQRLPHLDADQKRFLDKLYRNRLASLQAVDEMVEALVVELDHEGVLDHTVIVYTSDSGYHLGQHRRFRGKGGPYEEDVRVPLVVRGPGVPEGRVMDQLVLSTDIAPTLAGWAGASLPDWIDGRSLQPLLSAAPDAPPPWRRAFLIEKEKSDQSYLAVRTEREVYVERESGARELYDLVEDPDQLHSRHASLDAPALARWSAYLKALSGCAAKRCRELEDAGP